MDHDEPKLSPDRLVGALKAAAEPTRLRILTLLSHGELTVKDLTQILGQSQPRLSRHLKLMSEAGLIERYREGAWVYYTLSQRAEAGPLAYGLLARLDLDEEKVVRDLERAAALKRDRETTAQSYFERHAAEWDKIRRLHVAEEAVEEAIVGLCGDRDFGTMVDLGTGTGRMLELLSGHYQFGIGIDVNASMLSYARAKLAASDVRDAYVRHGDLYNLPMKTGEADLVIMHQVLHFLSNPGDALQEAARILSPDGLLLIVDFAPHELEHLRDDHAHERLGFSDAAIGKWLSAAGLDLTETREMPRASQDGETEGLTVKIWLACRDAQMARTPVGATADRDMLEEI